MIDPDKLKFDDVVYAVNEKNNAFLKKKIKMVDDNGVEWTRYDRDNWEYSINELVYCGRVTFEVTGEVPVTENHQEELYFRHPDNRIYSEYYEQIPEMEEWFYTQTEAEKYIELLKIQRSVE